MHPFRSLFHLLFPPRCPFCGSILDEGDTLPCRRCRTASFWLPDQQAVTYGYSFDRCVCVGWYIGALRTSLLRFKFHKHPDYAKAYGPMLAKAIRTHFGRSYDVITWVPVSPTTLEDRGYDQAELLAKETAAALGTSAVPLLVKSGRNVPQSSLNGSLKRAHNVAGVYTVPQPSEVAHRRILIIDDILTTGATLNEAAKTLREAGAKTVSAAAFCRTPSHP